MGLSLGVDTGGTYTDAVLIRDEVNVIASAKSLTTRENLALGIGRAVAAVMAEAEISGKDVSMVSLSTTLATNALVEGQGGRVCLVFIGFSEKDLGRQDLSVALNGDPVIAVSGGHNHGGGEVAPLDETALRAGLVDVAGGVTGFAVAAQFGTRNPAHELRAREIIREVTDKPVTCSHELSAKLGGPKRAMTAVLNARLIGMIDRLIGSAERYFKDQAIDAPLMVVRGDGALISSDQAKEKPIETILSGPAASIVGAKWLTDVDDALVSDIGGTTTDIALLKDGLPQIDPDGASVGGFRTMVEAVAMRTWGLGGDSQVHMVKEGLSGAVRLGPRRIAPVSLLAMDAPELVHGALDKVLKSGRLGEFDAQFLRPVYTDPLRDGLTHREEVVLDRIMEGPCKLQDAIKTRLDLGALEGVVKKGLVHKVGVTPSDAAHVLGLVDAWDGKAARKVLECFGLQRTGAGEPLATDTETMARKIIDQLTEQSADCLLEAAFAEEGLDAPGGLPRHVLALLGRKGHAAVSKIDLGLNLPVIGLGASAQAYYPAVGSHLKTASILPEHGGVANAIGAVVGQITMRRRGQVTSGGEGAFRAHLAGGVSVFKTKQEAFGAIEKEITDHALQAALQAGAVNVNCQYSYDVKEAEIENRTVFVEAEIEVVASGRPRSVRA
ncbi:MAG: hydantoinase/oxoprolinase family protein [Pseudomonadota bacterium]